MGSNKKMFPRGIRIYNLFPPLAGPFDRWRFHFERAAGMGFDWIYVNPLHYPGFSGSLYAVKDYYKLNPALIDAPGGRSSKRSGGRSGEQGEFGQLKQVIKTAKKLGLSMMMDLVINHTSIDSVLVEEHPDWYRRDAAGKIINPSCLDPADARKITVWGDLAEIDNYCSGDREGLWRYWEKLCLDYADLGFQGFRCDAAYQVPVELWARLIARLKKDHPDFIFAAETLGCKEKDIVALARAGFDYIYNSSKWWDLRADWCLRQLNGSRRFAPSISFPETHDTPRLAAETGGDIGQQKARYLLAAIFSKGLLMPMGYEFGFQRPMDVAATRPGWWEKPHFDLTGFITQVSRFKAQYSIFNEDNETHLIGNIGNGQVSGLLKISNDRQSKVLVLLNTDRNNVQSVVIRDLPGVFQTAGRFKMIGSGQKAKAIKTGDYKTSLEPSGVKMIYWPAD